MKLSLVSRPTRAFTATELAVVIVLVLVLGVVTIYSTLPATSRSKHGPGRAQMKCVQSLKQIGLAYWIFANDNNDKFPAATTGSLAYDNVTQAWEHFQTMSNELGSARILLCLLDRERLNDQATDFQADVRATATSLPTKGNRAVSYTASLDAAEVLPNMILSSDRHLATNRWNRDGRLFLAMFDGPAVTWMDKQHGGLMGNVLLADGSVPQSNGPSLDQQVRRQGIATNRLLLPLLP